MTTLTPDEADAYNKEGMLGAIRVVRYRLGLGLVYTKRYVEQWIAEGKNVSGEGEEVKIENERLRDLSEAILRARNAENQVQECKRQGRTIPLEVGTRFPEDLTEDQKQVWYRACKSVSEELERSMK